MKARLELYQFVNRLVYSALTPAKSPGSNELDVLDDDAITEEDELDFLRFEIALPEVTGTNNQLNLAADTETAESDDATWLSIERVVENEISDYGSRISYTDTPDASIPISHDTSIGNVNQFANSVVKEGQVDPKISSWLVPSSLDDLRAKVASMASVNSIIEQWRYKDFSPSSLESESEKSGEENFEQEKMPTERLYDILASRNCPAKEHRAFLQLSGFMPTSNESKRSPPKNDIVFNLFLSCCFSDKSTAGADVWDKTTCILERSEPPKFAGKDKINICSKLQVYRKFRTALALSFNEDIFWVTMNPRDEESPRYQSSRPLPTSHGSKPDVKLATLFQDQHLQSSDPDDMVRKFRFALQLARSLHQLYPGPWVHQGWSANLLHIMVGAETRPIEMLHDTYVSCVLRKDWEQRISFPEAVPDYCDRETCHRFFLSLAQLLVELVKGERDDRFSGELDSEDWLAMILDELDMKLFQDKPMDSYRRAIQGCLFYLQSYSNESQRTLDEKMRARAVIHQNIVLPLQRNLNAWAVQNHQTSGAHDGDFDNEIINSSAHAQNSISTRQLDDVFTAGVTPSSNTQGRPSIMSEYLLWSSEDDKPGERTALDPAMSENSFTTKMEMFLDHHIRKLPAPTGEGKNGKRVLIAVIDTGLHIDDYDIELQTFEKQGRIKERKNFFQPFRKDLNPEFPGLQGPDPDDWNDIHGHGTHVARLLLRFAPRAEIVVAKITNSRSLRTTEPTQLIEALKWAGKHADVINISFGLVLRPYPELNSEIDRLITKDRKLIFAAASNTGGNGSRSWPATRPGVFCIHAMDEFAKEAPRINPQALSRQDNFAVLGYQIDSYWKEKDISISGTSFATPIAAAIAANVLEFTRRMMPEAAELFTTYSIMRNLFREHMTDNSDDSIYHNIKPWVDDLWSPLNTNENVCEKLRHVAIRGDKKAK